MGIVSRSQGGGGIPQGGPLAVDLDADGNRLTNVGAVLGSNGGLLQMEAATVVRLLNTNGNTMVASNGNITELGFANAVSINAAGYLTVANDAAPANGDIFPGECALWFDRTNGVGNTKLMLKGKSADGTVKTAAVVLA